MSSSQFLAPPSHNSRKRSQNDTTKSQNPPTPSTSTQEVALPDPKIVCRDLASKIENFDFDRFFQAFPIDSVVSVFIESFSIQAFHDLMARAFQKAPLSEYDSPEAQDSRQARVELEEELCNLDTLLGLMEEAKLQVRDVRKSLGWVREVNQKAIDHDGLARAARMSTVHLAHKVCNLTNKDSSASRVRAVNQAPDCSHAHSASASLGSHGGDFSQYSQHIPVSRGHQNPKSYPLASSMPDSPTYYGAISSHSPGYYVCPDQSPGFYGVMSPQYSAYYASIVPPSPGHFEAVSPKFPGYHADVPPHPAGYYIPVPIYRGSSEHVTQETRNGPSRHTHARKPSGSAK